METMQRRAPETVERWRKALSRAMTAGLDPLEVVGAASPMFAVESTRAVGTVYLVDGEGRSCTCPAGQAGDSVCCHRAAVKFITGTLALPQAACPTCHGGGHLAVGWGGVVGRHRLPRLPGHRPGRDDDRAVHGCLPGPGPSAEADPAGGGCGCRCLASVSVWIK